jgi:hypothetical protein
MFSPNSYTFKIIKISLISEINYITFEEIDVIGVW